MVPVLSHIMNSLKNPDLLGMLNNLLFLQMLNMLSMLNLVPNFFARMRVERRDDENDMRLCIVELRLKEKWHDQYYSRGSLVLYFTVQ